jgi:hypothetical protein
VEDFIPGSTLAPDQYSYEICTLYKEGWEYTVMGPTMMKALGADLHEGEGVPFLNQVGRSGFCGGTVARQVADILLPSYTKPISLMNLRASCVSSLAVSMSEHDRAPQ